MNAPSRRVIHAVEKHHDFEAGERRRKDAAVATWNTLYLNHGVIPAHYTNYQRSAKAIGDSRDLPYLKDVLEFGMKQAGPEDVIFLTNDDIHVHPDIPDLLRFNCSLYEAVSAQRLDYQHGVPAFSQNGRWSHASVNSGRDLFAFTRAWLERNWDAIPDFILGASEWDWCLAGIIRKEKGLPITNQNMVEPLFPAELPLGYLVHVNHGAAWIRPENVNQSPSQIWNKELFKAWLALHVPSFRLSTYPGPTPPAMPAKQTISVRRTNSLGDVLAATCVADALIRQGHDVVFQSHPNAHPILRRHPKLKAVTEPNVLPVVDLDGAYENHPQRKTRHFAEMFFERANAQLAPFGINLGVPTNFAPRIVSMPNTRQEVAILMEPHPKPWVMICPRSQSFKHRSVPNPVWASAAGQIHGTKFWLGLDASPSSNIVDLQCRHVDRLIEFIGLADLLVTTDTGPMHIAASMGTPIVAIEQSSSPELHLSDQRDFVVIRPVGLNCLNCQQERCHLDPNDPPCQYLHVEQIVEAANARLRSVETEDASAIICVYKPDVQRLNKCIAHVINQVQEIVVVANLDTPWPLQGAIQHHKIRYVQRKQAGIGYSKNANFGVRHSNGKFIYLCNDDCFIEPNVIETLRGEMKPDIGAVTHTLRYENGTIQYAGKYREAGGRGFGHIDHRAIISRYTHPVYQESVCGCSMLVRRKAYYDADGYTENLRLYSEDDWLGMSLRKAGWRIVFTPHCSGVHMEHQSTKHVHDLNSILVESSALFAKEWGWYFDKNKDPNALGTF